MVVAGCFLEHDGKFVILFRHSHKPSGDTWGLPAGKVEDGETNEDAMLRELEEETGYAASAEQLEHLGDFGFGSGEGGYTFATYGVGLDGAFEPKLEERSHAEYRWVTPSECYRLENLVPDFHELLERLGFVK